MKRVLVLTAIVVFGFSDLQAQEIEFGAKLGINFSDILGDNTLRDGPITSIPMLAIYAEVPLNEKFSFQPELQYSPQGFGTGSGTDELVSLQYLNLPLMGKYYVTKGLSLEAGPQIGFLLGADSQGLDVKDAFKTLDFGVNVGLGYKLNNGLNFGFRYNLGLSNINGVDASPDSFRNGTGQLTVGYSFL
jgi:long-subunit fatty acid transport protein